MVTARNNRSRTTTFRRSFTGYLDSFGTTVSLIKPTKTKDGMNRVTAVSSATTTIKADIQWVTKQDLDYLNMGQAQVGDGMMFVEYGADVDIEDGVEFSSERWRVDSQIEGELVSGDVTFKGYLIKRNLQS